MSITDWADTDGRMRCPVCGRWLRRVHGKPGDAFGTWTCTNLTIDHETGTENAGTDRHPFTPRPE